jgi:hypothetical protein
LEEGVITLAEAEGISRVIGHSRETAKSCYVLQDTHRSVVNCKNAERIFGLADEYTNLQQNGDVTTDETANAERSSSSGDRNHSDIIPVSYVPKPFGTLHPDYDKKETNRIRFSPAEKESLIMIIDDMINSYGTLPDKLASRCIKVIWNSPHLVSIFHIRHALNSQRLRSCLKTLKYVS